MLFVILLVIGAVFCALEAFWFSGRTPSSPGPWPRPHFGWLGVALALLAFLLTRIH